MNLHRIEGVEPISGTFAVVLHWQDGRHTVKDLSSLIHSRRVFRPLMDPELFARVHVADEGRSIRWNGDIDYCADALWIETPEAQEPRRAYA